MKPAELLQQELETLLSAKRHSETSFKEGKIGSLLHEQHLENLQPKILEYKNAIRILKDATE
jgi:hypothetical protein